MRRIVILICAVALFALGAAAQQVSTGGATVTMPTASLADQIAKVRAEFQARVDSINVKKADIDRQLNEAMLLSDMKEQEKQKKLLDKEKRQVEGDARDVYKEWDRREYELIEKEELTIKAKEADIKRVEAEVKAGKKEMQFKKKEMAKLRRDVKMRAKKR